MNILLEITLRSRLVEKLCVAMYSCLFEVLDGDGDDMERFDEVKCRVSCFRILTIDSP